MLRKTSFSRLWYKPDTKFFRPKAYVKMEFNCPLAVSSPDAVVLSSMFVWLLEDCLNEYGKYLNCFNIDHQRGDSAALCCISYVYCITKTVSSIFCSLFQLIMLRMLVFTMD